ncbi:helix-turn-helix domain-containing protein [Streptomyces boncukensis]|uniref:Helix-turn-helix domain-containing protein n=1 Tax=Streptomyces boncukensis TaxID=2711219 RepID=A0A6G4WWT2_9ACTN|nr:helix-turn-helix transcriptional regulator [Streptomyces boncukensis]NGO68984.1 helix-turn-helix domain-containing protein [Streptomyces boncukensis]
MARPEEQDRASLAASLGSTVRRLREGRGWTQQDLADRLYVTPSRVAQVELATDPPNEALAQDLDRVLDAGDELNVAWFHMNRLGHPSWERPYVDLERRACRMRGYAPQLVPGILQTAGYAAALFSVVRPGISDEVLKRLVEARTSRQSLLGGRDPLHLWAVLDETILMRPFGDDESVMRDQLSHLLLTAAQPNVELQILPLEAGHHGMMDGPVTLLEFPDGPGVAYLAGTRGGDLAESPHTVKQYAMIYDRLIFNSLSPEESRDLIRSTLKERYGCPPPPPPPNDT